jgi:hypothetical protein
MRRVARGGTVERDRQRKEQEMSNARKWLRPLGALLTLSVVAALASATTPPAKAEGVTPEALAAAGWDCFLTPPFVVPPRIVCANPGLGRPFPGNPDPPPAYTLPTFDLGGNYLGKVHLVRADLYHGQPRSPSGDAYVFRAAIGYFECLRI